MAADQLPSILIFARAHPRVRLDTSRMNVLSRVVFPWVSQFLAVRTGYLRSAGRQCAKTILTLTTCCLLWQSATTARVKEVRRVLSFYRIDLTSLAAAMEDTFMEHGAVGGFGTPYSVVLNRHITVWDLQKKYIVITAILLFFTQTLLIVALLWQRARRRKTEADLIVANDRLRLAVESAISVGWEWDVKSGRDLRFGALPTMFGIPSNTYSGSVRDFYRYVHPDDRQRVSEAMTAARQDRKPYVAEYRIVRSDGAVRWVSARGQFYFARNGKAEQMLGMAVDVTDRRQAEEVQRRHDAIVEFSDDAIISKNLDGVIQS